MSASLDMSLEDIIRKNKGYGGGGGGGHNNFRGRGRAGVGGRGRGRGAGYGPVSGPNRRFVYRDPVRARPYPMPPPPRTVVGEPVMMPSGGGYNGESSTKLYVSNLEYSVSNGDIKLLFSDIGELKRYSIHYDKSGRSKGTAEVVFARQSDALAAIERYNNVRLDGKPMKIELVGPPPPPLPTPLIAASELGKYNSAFRSGQESVGVRGRGLGGVHGRGYARGQGQGRQQSEKLTPEELDADLDRYHFEAMKLS